MRLQSHLLIAQLIPPGMVRLCCSAAAEAAKAACAGRAPADAEQDGADPLQVGARAHASASVPWRHGLLPC
jgi:hypothetical protein